MRTFVSGLNSGYEVPEPPETAPNDPEQLAHTLVKMMEILSEQFTYDDAVSIIHTILNK